MLKRLMRQQHLIREGSWLFAGNTASIIGSFIVTLILANHVSPNTFGEYKYIVTASALAEIFCLCGLARALIPSVAREHQQPLHPYIVTYLRWAIPSAVGLLIMSGYYFYQENQFLGISFLLLSLFAPLAGALKLQSSFLVGKQLYPALTGYRTLMAILTTVTVGAAGYFTDSSLLLVTAYMGGVLLTLLVAYRMYIHVYRSTTPIEKVKEQISETVHYAKHLSLMSILSGAASHVDKIIVFQLLGSAELAIYTIALTMPNLLATPTQLLSALVLPKSARKTLSQLRSLLPKRIALLIIGNTAVACVYYFSAPYIFEWFFPQYLEAIPFSAIYVWFLVLSPIAIFGSVLTAHRAMNAQYINAIVPATIKIFLLLFLVPLYGIMGAILALLLAKVVSHGFNIFFFLRVSRQKSTATS